MPQPAPRPKSGAKANSPAKKPPTGGQRAPAPAPAPGRGERLVRLYTRFERFLWDFGGVFCLALALMTLLGLLVPTLAGGLLNWWASTIFTWFGWGALWLAAGLGALGIWMLRKRYRAGSLRIAWGRLITLELAALISLAWLAALAGGSLVSAQDGMGGRIGWALEELLNMALSAIGLGSPVWSVMLLSALLFFSLFIGLGFAHMMAAWANRPTTTAARSTSGEPSELAAVSEAPLQPAAGLAAAGAKDTAGRKKPPVIPPEYRKNFRVDADEQDRPAPPQARDERLPPLDLLIAEQSYRPDERSINQTAGMIEKTLAEFGIPAKVVGFKVGPTVTQFAVEPGFLEKEKANSEEEIKRQKVRVAQIAGLARDLALALSAERLRIEAPVPGRPYVGIEVPNLRASIVRLRPILETEAFYKVGSPLAIALGRDVSGQPVVADLGRMPHLLVAGTTGSGKSVCIAAITACLVMNNTPDDLRLVMVDPKMVELVRFNGLPHLIGKVETNLERILTVLRWTVAEMDRRYKILEASHSRNIDSYNRKARRRAGAELLPRLVLMIDELADLMMSMPDQTEHNLVRLAQMARATGIHLVVATQRPSTDVVTGLIKANFPARISFAMASSIDSRVILDATGAEALLGRGDMLFVPPEASAPQRAQGVMIGDPEIERLITYWQKVAPPADLAAPSPWEQMLEQETVVADRDALIEQAIKVVQEEQRASASMLQRRLRIGYPRAARLVDELEELGVIGPAQGGGREREVLIARDDDGEREYREEEQF